MNTLKLVKNVAKQTGVDKETVDLIVNVTFGEIKKNLENKIEVHISRFGRFIIKHRNPRPAHDMRNKKTIMIPPRDMPFWRPYFGKKGV